MLTSIVPFYRPEGKFVNIVNHVFDIKFPLFGLFKMIEIDAKGDRDLIANLKFMLKETVIFKIP